MAQFEAEALPQLALGQDAEVAAGVGLMNGIGEYNCFLNVIVQCLWHLTNFRKGILACEPLVKPLPLRVPARCPLSKAASHAEPPASNMPSTHCL